MLSPKVPTIFTGQTTDLIQDYQLQQPMLSPKVPTIFTGQTTDLIQDYQLQQPMLSHKEQRTNTIHHFCLRVIWQEQQPMPYPKVLLTLYMTQNGWATYLAGTTTDALSEGSNNLYWTNNRFDTRLSATTTLPNLTTLLGLTNASTTALTVTGPSYFTSSTTFNGIEYLFPSTDGINGQFLSTNANGGLSWTTAGGAFASSGGFTTLSTITDNVGIGTTSPYAKLSVVGETVAEYFTATSTSATSTFAGGLNVGSGALTYNFSTTNIGVGTLSPARKFSVLNTSANPQLRVSYDMTNYSELTVSAVGDLTISTTGGDISLLDENFRVCAGGACPSDPSGLSGNGNILAEGALYAMSSTATSTFAGGVKLNKADTGIEFSDGSIQTTASVDNTVVPASAVMAFARPTCPSGWLSANGAAVSRTTYADLFAAISTMYGVGDGSTTFNMPDYRGEFLRGIDNGAGRDPDSASRTNRGDGTTGDNIGTKQTEQTLSHLHAVDPPSTSSNTTGAHTHTYTFWDGGGGTAADTNQYSSGNANTSSNGDHSHTVDIASFDSGSTGGNETRPRNVNVLYCVKY